LIAPELTDDLAGVDCEHRFIIGPDTDEALFAGSDVEPRPWEPDEDATAAINYTSGTTARPKGVQVTHRTIWLNAVTFGWSAGVSDRDVYLHTLPMFLWIGCGMPFALTGVGA
ncbi:MAG: AMP-binding protein, partial [Acidimicrobiia bacterium]|nr:AMP-binding protein [Acidimicrobiia bacterium]